MVISATFAISEEKKNSENKVRGKLSAWIIFFFEIIKFKGGKKYIIILQ